MTNIDVNRHTKKIYIVGWAQHCDNSITYALQLLQFCAKPLILYARLIVFDKSHFHWPFHYPNRLFGVPPRKQESNVLQENYVVTLPDSTEVGGLFTNRVQL